MVPPQSTAVPQRLSLPPERRVVLCVGPGGVGKTTVAAALGLAASRAGRRVAVVTIDPSRRLAQALGVDPERHDPGTVVEVPGTGGAGQPLHCLLLHTQSVFDGIVRSHSPDPAAAERMLNNRLYIATVQQLGGALEYAAMARVHMLAAEGRYDLIVLDTPPTANAIQFLEAPKRIGELLDNPAAKFLAGSGALGMKFLGLASSVMRKAFEMIGGGPFIGELGDFLRDFGYVLTEFQSRAGGVAELLTSPGTGVVLTTAATIFSVREAKDFIRVLTERNLRIDGVVLNRVDPLVPPMPPPDLLRAAIARDFGESTADTGLARFAHTYEGARVQSLRVHEVENDLVRSYPELPICSIPRMSPPPSSLEELRSMGTALLSE